MPIFGSRFVEMYLSQKTVASMAHVTEIVFLSTAHLRTKCGFSWRKYYSRMYCTISMELHPVLPSPRTLRENSCSSNLAEQEHLIAFPNRPLEKSGVESRAVRNTWHPRMSFRLGWKLSSIRVCLRCKSRIVAPIAFAAHRTAPTASIWLALYAGLALFLFSQTAIAQCVPGGTTLPSPSIVSCNPPGQTTRLGQGPGADNVTVTVQDGTTISVTDTNAISLGNGTLGANSTITLGSGPNGGSAANPPVVIHTDTNGTATSGQYGKGDNTIEFNNNYTLTINRNATVEATGTETTSEAINPIGSGNHIINYGFIDGGPSSAIFFDNVNTTATSPRNSVDNFGTINAPPGPNPDTSGQAIGSFNNVGIDVTNETGGHINGNLQLQGGNDTVTLNPGSVITGLLDGGGGTNALTLNASGTSSDTLPGAVSDFQTLSKTGTGTWTLTGAIGANGNAVPLAVTVEGGTLVLTGNNTAFNGSVVIDSNATLEARAQSLPPAINDLSGDLLINQVSPDGVQPNDGTYAGHIVGTGVVTKIGVGTLTMTGANSYSGGTVFDEGAIAASADSAFGAPTGPLIFNGGELRLDSNFNLAATRTITLNGPGGGFAGGGTIDANGFQTTIAQGITGAGGLTVTDSSVSGAGKVILAGSTTYLGGTTISAGTLQLGNGGASGSIIGNVADNGTLAFDRSDIVTFGGMISGSGGINQIGFGTTVLTGSNSYAGPTNVNAGALYVNGNQTAATGATTVANGATLGGVGVVGGNVAIANGGTLAPGSAGPTIGTLTINGDLDLHSGSILNYEFGQNNVVGGPFNDLTAVKGNLTLAGTLNVATTPGGEFDPGVYRVISYSGSLTNDGLGLGIVPPDSVEVVQTSVANQVNLVVTTGVTLNFWDGAVGPKNNGIVDGGNGVWNTGTGANDNWTNASGAINAPWTPAAFAIFEATPGTVMVDNSLGQVTASGMQFASDGYLITGGPISLVETTAGSGETIIRVGDGTVVGAGMTATIASVLEGATELVKTDLGTLVLSGVNTYTGGTAINGGTVQVAADNNLGAATSGLSFDGGTLATTASFTTNRATTLNANGGTFDVAPTTTLTMTSAIDGAGALTKVDIGTLVLTGTNTYSGGTTITSGTLQLGDGGSVGSIVGNVADSGTLAFDRSDTMDFAGVISGSGAVTQIGSGATVLTGASTYLGGTAITAGTLQLGNGGTTGSILGNVLDKGTLAFDRSDTVTFPGVVSGSGAVAQIGSGATILNADNPYTGGTTVSAGTLVVGDLAHPGAALSGGGPISVEASGTLGGYGSVTGTVANSGVIAAGSATPGFIGSPTGTFNVIGDLTNQGTVQLGSGDSIGNVLHVNGNFMGAAGSTLAINTFLGGDGSPSDTLVISGAGAAATGNTIVHVTNVGGPGEETTANGILVVNATGGATTASSAFTLANPELRAGAFDYDLFRGGVSGSANDWFLRSSFIVPPIPPEPPTPEPPVVPPTPPPNPLPPGVYPIIGPELATYGVVQPLARELGLSILGTLDDRLGDTYEPDGCAVAPTPSAAETPAVDLPTKKPAAVPTKKPGPAPCPLFSPSVWGRFFGQTVHNQYSAFADPRASGNLGGFQGGIDLLRGSLIAGHSERAGLYGAYGDVNADVDGLVTNPAATAYVLTHTGSMNLTAWSAGGYWTHTGPGGWYLDAVLQGTWYYGSASTQFARLNTDGTGFIGSLEGGYPFSWPQLGPGFVIEPQGQMLWQKVSFRHDYDGEGDVALGDTTGPSGRIGLRTKWTIVTAGGQVWQPYLRGNLWRDWGAEANAVYSGTDIVPLESQTTMLELGGGLTGRINANVSVFANVDYEFAVGAADDKRNGVRGAFGAKYTW
jgi:outer membrane autotransporter protein